VLRYAIIEDHEKWKEAAEYKQAIADMESLGMDSGLGSANMGERHVSCDVAVGREGK
jgi:hypothetical protein